MLSQLHQAKASGSAFQRKVQVSTDNLANSQTVGFKARSMNMESLFPFALESVIKEIQDPTVSISKKKRRYVQFGSSIRQADSYTDWSQGALESTNRDLDIAIQGEGFFQFRMPDGSIGYGRAGNLSIDAERVVQDPNGHPLEPALVIPENTTQVIINPSGQVFAKLPESVDPVEIGQIIVARFPNKQGLKSLGQNLYQQTELSGDPILVDPGTERAGTIRQRQLELSNVNTINEMVDLLMGQRMFQMNIGAMKTGGDMVKMTFDIPK